MYLLSPSAAVSSSHHVTSSSDDSAAIAVLLSVLLLLSLLLACKRIFLKARKLRQPPPRSNLIQSPAHSPVFSFPFFEGDSAKAAFLVGFFGSPGRETSTRNVAGKSEREQTSTYSSLAGSIVSGSFQRLKRNLADESPLLRTVDDFHTLNRGSRGRGQQRTVSLAIPNRPLFSSIAGSPIIPALRRFSLSSLSLPENISLRPALQTEITEYHRPLLLRHVLSLETSPLSLRNISPPLPLVARPLLESVTRAFPLPQPYLTTPGSAKHCLPSNDQISGGQNDFHNNHISVSWECLSPASRPIKHASQFSLQPQPVSIISSLVKPINAARIAWSPRRSSVRGRRSLTAGPSPLRSMTLPNALSESNMGLEESPPTLGSRGSDGSVFYPSIARTSDAANSLERSCYGGIANNDDAVLDAKQPDMLLSLLLRELVEETSQWDPSVFKHRNFKAMIENSKHPDYIRAQAQVVKERNACKRDMGLDPHDMDIFRNGYETSIPHARVKHPLNMNQTTEIPTKYSQPEHHIKGGHFGVAY